ncbi:MAG: pilus assembly protein [Chloroflexi bacterium]|nr:pilus assembly protein [Chloroflexota bacterium]
MSFHSIWPWAARGRGRVADAGPGGSAGQSTTEFALVIPILFLMVVAISDFGRLYTSMVAVESAAREAADYGSFKATYWTAANAATTAGEMERRACTAAAGSHLEDYSEPPGTVNHATCSNPVITCAVEPSDGSPAQDCATYDGATGLCAESTTEPPCTIHVTLTYTFQTFLRIPPLPPSVTFDRESIFRISDLPVPAGP